MGDVGGAGESALLATCSEDSVRSTYGPGIERTGLPPVLTKLVALVNEDLSAEDRMLLDWVAAQTPNSLIASWLGITRTGAVKRVTRLRARLKKAAVRFGDALGPEDSLALEKFLRRTGVDRGADVERPSRGRRPQVDHQHPVRRRRAGTDGGDE